jgi:hypothetical protein
MSVMGRLVGTAMNDRIRLLNRARDLEDEVRRWKYVTLDYGC